MDILVVDTETTGLSPYGNHVVEIAANKLNLESYQYTTVLNSVCNPGLSQKDLENAWICLNGYIKPEEILAAKPSSEITLELNKVIRDVNAQWTCFNISFDAAFLQKEPWFVSWPNLPCIMEVATPHCGIPSPYYGIKWPTLSEAYSILVHPKPRSPWNAHRALADTCMATHVLISLHKAGFYQTNGEVPA